MATVVIGANTQPMPTPAMASAGRKSYHWEVGVASPMVQAMPPANRNSPVIRMNLPPILSVRRPATGATNIDTSEAGAIVRPAFSAVNPRTDWK
jgi:hypothetical protein